MATYTIYMYAPDALAYDDEEEEWVLRADFDPYEHRVRVEITDDGEFLDGDLYNDEVGSDLNQTAIVYDMEGSVIASGPIYDELYFVLENFPSAIAVDQIEIGGVVVGYTASEPLQPGVTYEENGRGDVSWDYGSAYALPFIPSVPCFGPGTHLLTTEGEVPVEWLAAGHKLITKDTGPEPVLWVGRYDVSRDLIQKNPALAPFEISENAFGPGCPNHPLQLSRQHRVLMTGYSVELHAGVDEAFAAAGFLEDADKITRVSDACDIRYTHVLLPSHAIIQANGLWTESLYLGDEIDTRFTHSLSRTLSRNPAISKGHRQTARMCLKRWQVTAMLGFSSNRAAQNRPHQVA